MRYGTADLRREALVQQLSSRGYLSYAEAADAFGVSEMTVRRDVEQLELDGRARRVSGGAGLPGTQPNLPYESRDRLDVVAKRVIGRAAAASLADAAVVALDAGTTVLHTIDVIAADTTVVTHSIPAITGVGGRADLELIGLGGRYVPSTRSFAGLSVVDAIAGLAIDVAVVSATAIDRSGLLCASQSDAEIKRTLIDAAERVIVLADSSKLDARAPIRFGRWRDVEVLITDSGADRRSLDQLRAAGADIFVADVS